LSVDRLIVTEFIVLVSAAVGLLSVTPLRAPQALTRVALPLGSLVIIGLVLRTINWPHFPLVAVSAPFLIASAAAGGLIAGTLRNPRHRALAAVPLLVALPFARSIASRTTTMSPMRSITDTIVARALPGDVWEFILSVDSIRPHERRGAFYTTIGFPEQVAAELDDPRIGGKRQMLLSRGAGRTETITDFMERERVAFSITSDTSEPPYFRLRRATYELAPHGDSATLVTVALQYETATPFNIYASRWFDRVVSSMAGELLRIIGSRAERALHDGTPIITADMRKLDRALLGTALATMDAIPGTFATSAMTLRATAPSTRSAESAYSRAQRRMTSMRHSAMS
jgi:hypothetical protein